MTKSQATAEVFLTAFHALSKKEREKVILGITRNKRLREDLIDLALIQERKNLLVHFENTSRAEVKNKLGRRFPM